MAELGSLAISGDVKNKRNSGTHEVDQNDVNTHTHTHNTHTHTHTHTEAFK